MNNGYDGGDQEPKSGNVPIWAVALLVITILVLTAAVIAMASVFRAAREPGPLPTLVPTAAASATVSPTLPAPIETTETGGLATATGLPPVTLTPGQANTAVPSVTATSSATSLPIPTNTPVPPVSTNTPVVIVPTLTPLPTNTPWPTAAPNAWYAEYYNNRGLVGGPVVVRNEGNISFDWGAGVPASGIPADAFSARWTRTLAFPAGTYRFNVASDDGVRVWLDSQLIIDEWHDAANTTYSAQRTLPAGNHTVRVEYEENWGNARIRFWWEDAGSYPEWRGEYFANANLSGGPAVVRNDPNINFNWGTGAPSPGMPADNFSVRWSRSLYLDAGTYTFRISVDDGVRLYLDGRLIIDQWRDGSQRDVSATVPVSAGNHNLRLEYYERTSEAVVVLNLIQEEPIVYPDWRGEYWANISLSGQPALIRNDQQIDFRWGTGAPYPGLPADQFSVRWSRQIRLSESGSYRFYAQSDDGIRVYVDGSLILNEWHDSSASITYLAEVNLQAGAHTVVAEYYENRSTAQIRFWFERIPPTPTPSATPTSTATPTNSPPPTSTPQKIATPVPTNTPSPTPTNMPKPTNTPKPTETPRPTATPSPTPTETPRPTETPVPTETPRPTATPSPTPKPTKTPASVVYLSEILASPSEVDWNGDGTVGGGDEWIELFNNGTKPINLGRWILRGQGEGQIRYQIRPGTVIKPGKYLLLYRSETNIDLAASGGTLELVNADGQVIDSVTYPALAADASYSRDDLGHWHNDWVPSPGVQNTPQGSGLQQPEQKGKKK